MMAPNASELSGDSAPGLACDFVESYWILQSDGSEPECVQRVVPDGAAEPIPNFAHPFESCHEAQWRLQPRRFLEGQITGPLLLRPTGLTRMLGIRFAPRGAGRLLATPMGETPSRAPLDATALARGLGISLCHVARRFWSAATFGPTPFSRMRILRRGASGPRLPGIRRRESGPPRSPFPGCRFFPRRPRGGPLCYLTE